jgi:hypothetical protein
MTECRVTAGDRRANRVPGFDKQTRQCEAVLRSLAEDPTPPAWRLSAPTPYAAGSFRRKHSSDQPEYMAGTHASPHS